MKDTRKTIVQRTRQEQGAALIIALLATMLMTALGLALVSLTMTETMVSGNYRDAEEALYAADAAIERVVQDVLSVPRWNDILSGGMQSGFIDSTVTPTIHGGEQLNLNTLTSDLQQTTDSQNLWGANNPLWRLYGYGPVSDLLPTGTIDSRMYVVVWVADDPSDAPPGSSQIDGNPQADANGVLTLHAEAYGPGGTKKVVEVTVARTANTEIERGQIAQRGQEELNQRARKAAVQTPGKGVDEMRMNVKSGGLAVQ